MHTPLPPPPCIFSNAIGYLEYLNAVISCRKLRLDLCVCAPLMCTPFETHKLQVQLCKELQLFVAYFCAQLKSSASMTRPRLPLFLTELIDNLNNLYDENKKIEVLYIIRTLLQ